MKRVLYNIKFYGLWTIPFNIIAGRQIIAHLHPDRALTLDERILIAMATAGLCLFIISRNVLRTANERNPDIGWFTWLSRPEESEAITGKLKHSYPPVPEEMLYERPVGFVFGIYKGRYVCLDPAKEGHILVSAQSGCGKSAMFAITSIMACGGISNEE